jgi:hypothetical protein
MSLLEVQHLTHRFLIVQLLFGISILLLRKENLLSWQEKMDLEKHFSFAILTVFSFRQKEMYY